MNEKEVNKRIKDCIKHKSTALDLSELEISNLGDIKRLHECTHIEVLDLSDNQIAHIEGLETLTGLTSLYLWDNQIARIEGLETLTGLTELYLSGNQIARIDGLVEVTKLQSISQFYVDNNPFLQDVDIVLEKFENHLDVIRNLLLQSDPAEDAPYEYPVKLVVLGNHAMGKSNLVEYLLTDSMTSLEDKANDKRSTHGLKVIPFYFDKEASAFPDAMIYDFGGQDYYHGLYRSYLNYGCNYIILWKPQNGKCLPGEDNTGLDNYYFNVQYWLGQKVYYDSTTYGEGEPGPVFLIQGYADEKGTQSPNLDGFDEQQIRQRMSICLSPDGVKKNKIKLDYLKESIKELIQAQKQSAQKQSVQKAAWYKEFIKHIYDGLSKDNPNPVPASSLEKLFKKGNLRTELNQLHNKGMVIYFQDILPDLVWLNPSAFSDYVWQRILSKDKLAKYEGRLPASELESFPNEVLILKEQKIIFHYEKDNIYLVPNFLTAARLEEVSYITAVEDFSDPDFILYFQHFVPIPIINQAICYFGNHNNAQFWKDELRFTLKNECKVRIYFDIQQFTISIFLAKIGEHNFDREMVMAYLFHCLIRMYWNFDILEDFEEFVAIRRYAVNTETDKTSFSHFMDFSEKSTLYGKGSMASKKKAVLPGEAIGEEEFKNSYRIKF